MKVRFHPDAEVELSEGVEYYEDVSIGLGQEFALEVYSAIQRAIQNPKIWVILDGDIRRSLVKRFPYGILYSEDTDGILNEYSGNPTTKPRRLRPLTALPTKPEPLPRLITQIRSVPWRRQKAA